MIDNSNCGLPFTTNDKILMAHGGGGRMMAHLIRDLIRRELDNEWLSQEHDASVFSAPGSRLAMTTDSYVVHPLFFPGGDIGKLAVYGTVNDLAMSGARARYLTFGLILEEGLPMETLTRVVQSVAVAARECGVKIITGDTKVVERGKGDGIFINTAGVGECIATEEISPRNVREGDVIVVSGDLGRHGSALLSAREGLAFESVIESDCAWLWPEVKAWIEEKVEIHCLRDLTRGGLASALNEISGKCGLSMTVEEENIPVSDGVRGACEILGLDPLYVANEGRMIGIIPEKDAHRALEIWRKIDPSGEKMPAIIGYVGRAEQGRPSVQLKTRFGNNRVLDLLSGEQLPRIC